MKEKKQNDISVLLDYAGRYKGLMFLGLGLSGIAMALGMAPYICIWLAIRDLIAVSPNWPEATGIARYGWMAFAFAFGGIAVYFAALMCTHLAAFRTASNIRKQGMAHLMKAPLGFFDSNASGLLRNRLDGAAADTETLLAHNLADIVGSLVMLIAMIVLMVVFDWRMGASCLLAAVISILAMFSMMGGGQECGTHGGVSGGAGYDEQGRDGIRAWNTRRKGVPADRLFLQGVQAGD